MSCWKNSDINTQILPAEGDTIKANIEGFDLFIHILIVACTPWFAILAVAMQTMKSPYVT